MGSLAKQFFRSFTSASCFVTRPSISASPPTFICVQCVPTDVLSFRILILTTLNLSLYSLYCSLQFVSAEVVQIVLIPFPNSMNSFCALVCVLSGLFSLVCSIKCLEAAHDAFIPYIPPGGSGRVLIWTLSGPSAPAALVLFDLISKRPLWAPRRAPMVALAPPDSCPAAKCYVK